MEAEEIISNYFKYIGRAEMLMEVARWREALHELRQHLAEFPDDYFALCNVALCHFQLKEYQIAYDTTKLAIAVNPDGEWAYRLQSNIFSENGEAKRSLEAAQLCIEKAPSLPAAVHCLFWAQANYGELDKAEVTLQSLLELIPGGAEAHEASGFLALKLKQFGEAEKHYLEALKLDPESVNALNNLGVVYLEMAQAGKGLHYKQKSVEMFKNAVRIQPTFRLAQENISAASNAVKFGVPVGTILLIWFGLRIVSYPLHEVYRENISSVTASLADSSFVLTAANIYTLILVLAAIGTLIIATFARYREPILYQLATTKAWLFILAACSLAIILYIVGFWHLGNDATVISGTAFAIALVFALVAALNAVLQWRLHRR